jgi:hypothetical protein
MRPVVLQMGVTLDGFVHGAKGYQDWGLPPEEDEVVAWKAASLREAVRTLHLGRQHPDGLGSMFGLLCRSHR